MEVLFDPHNGLCFALTHNSTSFYELVSETIDYDLNIHPRLVSTTDLDIKCMCWNPSSDYKHCIALGLMNGKTALRVVGSGSGDRHYPIFKELVSKCSRPCNALAWSPLNPTWLATGFEKHRGAKYSLLIWDILKNSDHQLIKSSGTTENRNNTTSKPLLETSNGDTVNSLAWVGNSISSSSLIAGHGKKYLKVYDIRTQQNRPASAPINHKATMGICVNPLLESQIASFGDSTVALWDLRNFTKPMLCFNVEQDISKIEWSPSRNGFLAVLEGDSSVNNDFINIYDTNWAAAELELHQPSFVTVKTVLPAGDGLSTFCWSANEKNRLLTVTNSLTFKYPVVTEKISVACGSGDDFAIASGNTVCGFNLAGQDEATENDSEFIDYTSLFKKRAENLYGLNTEQPFKNVKLSLQPTNGNLKALWRFIAIVKQMASTLPQTNATTPTSPVAWSSRQKSRQNLSKAPPSLCFAGVQSLLKGEAQTSSTESITWVGLDSSKSTIYTSLKRNIALAMCDWGLFTPATPSDDDNRFTRPGFLDDLVKRSSETSGVERSCAIALWHGNIKLAIQILNSTTNTQDSSSGQISMVCMAMSGYTGINSPSLWLETCHNLSEKLHSPYMEAVFAFLLANAQDMNKVKDHAGKYEKILNNKGLLLQDRVAFACIYLPDNLLDIYLNELAVSAVESGSLDGILVTGLSTNSCISLLQNYLNKTFDLQTILTAVMHTGDKSFLSQPNILHWKESYTELLNKWKLYFERSDFEKAWNKATDSNPDSQIYVACNYCGKHVSNAKFLATCIVQHKAPTSSPVPSPSGRSMRHLIDKARSNTVPQNLHSLCGSLKRRTKSGTQTQEPKFEFSSTDPSRGTRFMGGSLAMQSSITSCPSCRKPLPRCSICLTHLGARPEETNFQNWLSWCMSCKHGGHAQHLLDWFEEHHECPVADCKCICNVSLG